MSDLASQTCIPCRGGIPPLRGEQITRLQMKVSGWSVVDEHHLVKDFTFPDFATGLTFVNRAGAIADEQGHHPDVHLSWGRVEITLWTHKIDGLTESDFIMAAKIDELTGG